MLIVRFIDMKAMLYYLHFNVPEIKYEDMVDYYKVPELACPPIQYSAIFEQVIHDTNINIGKLYPFYQTIHPLGS